MNIVRNHHKNPDTRIQEYLAAANITAQLIGAELNISKTVGQQYPSNPPISNSTKFWKRSLLILNSILRFIDNLIKTKIF